MAFGSVADELSTSDEGEEGEEGDGGSTGTLRAHAKPPPKIDREIKALIEPRIELSNRGGFVLQIACDTGSRTEW